VSRGEPCITELQFLTLEQLRARRDAMETWSQFALDFVLANPGAAGLQTSDRSVVRPVTGPQRIATSRRR